MRWGRLSSLQCTHPMVSKEMVLILSPLLKGIACKYGFACSLSALHGLLLSSRLLDVDGWLSCFCPSCIESGSFCFSSSTLGSLVLVTFSWRFVSPRSE